MEQVLINFLMLAIRFGCGLIFGCRVREPKCGAGSNDPQVWWNWFGYTTGIVILCATIVQQIVAIRGGPSIPIEIYTLMGILAGAVFGATVIRKRDE